MGRYKSPSCTAILTTRCTQATLSVIIGVGFITGQVLAGSFARQIGKMKFQCIVAFLGGGAFGSAATVQIDNKASQIATIFLGCVFIDWNESICLTNTTVLVKDQREVGVAASSPPS